MTIHGIEERRDVSEEDVVTSHNSRRSQAVLLSFKNPFQHDGREVAKLGGKRVETKLLADPYITAPLPSSELRSPAN